MKTESEKLQFLLRLIVTCGGPDQPEHISDEVFLLAVSEWMLNLSLKEPKP